MKGIIYKSTGSWYTVKAEDGSFYNARLRGKFKNLGLKVTNPLSVGDFVEMNIDPLTPTEALIHAIAPRTNYIIRRSSHKTAFGHLIACNIDQSILLVTLKQPKTSIGFIDRFLISCEAFRIPAVIVFNKSDLYNEELMEEYLYLKDVYTPLGYTCILTSMEKENGLDELMPLLYGKTSVISGHSGVGKSTLVNKIFPQLALKTDIISGHSQKGKHTTTFAEMYDLNADSKVIDTPGIKELGLFEIEDQVLSHYFPEMRKLMGTCKFHNCMHTNEPGCKVKAAVEAFMIAPSRYESYCSIVFEKDTHR
ncbi:ribosome small subunit-dependent GTPase A [uncultured Cytophaga sp.]|uniref:ribosome small subunit-dependent GTPase A n=1 Tax=uncultured Cytophaga sp. TaxID=160238 RepID=UPI00262B7948|nr:ribosome small subunit-dependent GTPase A [uncultured Cytophaga sp.]